MSKNEKSGANKNNGRSALLIVDLQKKFFSTSYDGTKDGEQVAKRVVAAAPAFRQAGWAIYVICYFDLGMIFSGAARLQEFKPEKSDRKIWKYDDTPFGSSLISTYLKRDNINSIAVCGGNLPCCVRVTCEDALKAGYNVHLLKDLTGSCRYRSGRPEDAIADLQERGVHITDTESILRSSGQPVIAIPSIR